MFKEDIEKDAGETITSEPKNPNERNKKVIRPRGKEVVVYRVSKRHLMIIDDKGNGFRVPIGKRTNIKPGDSIFME